METGTVETGTVETGTVETGAARAGSTGRSSRIGTAPAIDPFSSLNTGTGTGEPASAAVLGEGGLGENRPSDADTLGTSLGEGDSARTQALTGRDNGNDAEQAGGPPADDVPTFIRP